MERGNIGKEKLEATGQRQTIEIKGQKSQVPVKRRVNSGRRSEARGQRTEVGNQKTEQDGSVRGDP